MRTYNPAQVGEPKIMLLNINGKPEEVQNASTIGDLLRHFDLPPIRVAVEVNSELVSRKEFDQTPLHDGDNIEIVTFVGGG